MFCSRLMRVDEAGPSRNLIKNRRRPIAIAAHAELAMGCDSADSAIHFIEDAAPVVNTYGHALDPKLGDGRE